MIVAGAVLIWGLRIRVVWVFLCYVLIGSVVLLVVCSFTFRWTIVYVGELVFAGCVFDVCWSRGW